MVDRTAGQISAHPKRCLYALIVTGKLKERAIAHALIKKLCSFVCRADFQGDAEYARDDGAFLEPLEKLASDACSSIGRSHSKKVQMRVVVAVAHDRKTSDVFVNAGDEYVNIGGANTRYHPLGCPAPLETVLN
jgi:hypothetical protein